MIQFLDHVERILKPASPREVDEAAVARYAARRLKEPGKAKGSTVSVATVNKELRTLRAALNRARKWKFIDAAPEIELLTEDRKLPRVMLPEHFAAIYAACDVATLPQYQGCTPGDWWRACASTAASTSAVPWP